MRILVYSLFLCLVSAKSLYLPAPAEKSGDAVCLVILQGAGLSPKRYNQIAVEIQTATSVPLHVSIPKFSANLALPFSIKFIRSLHKKIAKATKPFPNDCPVFLSGHSLGAAAVQHEMMKHGGDYVASILLGASVLRDNYAHYPRPVLTVNGELDGLHRIRFILYF